MSIKSNNDDASKTKVDHYFVAPVNLKVVPPNLRPFVTPSIRRLYIDPHSPDEQQAPIASTSSEVPRLQAENHALRNHCLMLRRRAEIQGSANLNLIKLALMMREQASLLARERDELEKRCARLKRKLDDDELRQNFISLRVHDINWFPIFRSLTRGNATSCSSSARSVKTEPLEAPSVPFSSSPTLLPPCSLSRHHIDGSAPPRKRLRIDSPQAIHCARSAAERIAIWRKEVSDSMPLP